MSSSFSFAACRAYRACGRGEAAWVTIDRCSYHWAWRCCRTAFRFNFAVIPLTSKSFRCVRECELVFAVILYGFNGFKDLPFLFGSTVQYLVDMSLKKDYVK